MEGQPGATVSNRAWIELLHAEVCWVLAGAGVDALVIKGPSIAQWLYPEGGRESADVDLLVRPAHWDRAVEVLTERGFRDTLDDFRDGEAPPHSVTLSRTDPELGAHAVDLHRHFPGMDASPATTFDALWGRRVEASQAGVPVWFPDVTSRALVIALHIARDPHPAKTAEDLRRAWAELDADHRRELRDLATQVHAEPALRAGLETLPETTPGVQELGLSDVEVPAIWVLQSQGASGTALHLFEVAEQPLWRRPVTALRWAFPSPAVMRIRDPRASRGTVALSGAYARRLRDGLRDLPRALRELRRARAARTGDRGRRSR
jgi:Uncharacterised nucleotidyltransferase